MPSSRFLLSSICLSVVLVGCGEPTMDGSSLEAMKSSAASAREDMDAEQRARFDDALKTVAFEQMAPGGNLFAALGKDPDAMQAQMLQQLDGKSPTEIMSMADGILAERAAKQQRQMRGEVEELLAKQATAAQAKESLAKFELTRSRFYKRPQRYGRDEPVIELDVRNGTDVAVSRAHFAGTLATPGRSVPWLRKDFNYAIAGGLEPGESATWNLAPNAYSEWGTVDVPEGAVFTVEVLRLDGPDGEAAIDAEGFTEDNAKRLAELQKQLASP